MGFRRRSRSWTFEAETPQRGTVSSTAVGVRQVFRLQRATGGLLARRLAEMAHRPRAPAQQERGVPVGGYRTLQSFHRHAPRPLSRGIARWFHTRNQADATAHGYVAAPRRSTPLSSEVNATSEPNPMPSVSDISAMGIPPRARPPDHTVPDARPSPRRRRSRQSPRRGRSRTASRRSMKDLHGDAGARQNAGPLPAFPCRRRSRRPGSGSSAKADFTVDVRVAGR
jgi:hypothetical protein